MASMASMASPIQIVLLGATGFTGQAVLRQLACKSGAKEAHVLMHRRHANIPYDFAHLHNGSMTALPAALFPAAPHIVIHCASKQIDRDGSGFADNLRGIECLGRVINSHTRAILYASSYSVYGDGPQRGVTEESALQPQTPLARSRAACEAKLAALAKAHGIACIAFRPRFVIGEGDAFFLPGLIKLARTRWKINEEAQRFSLIDVDDYANVMLDVTQRILDQPNTIASFSAFNVAYEKPISLAEIRAILEEAISLPAPHYRLPVNETCLHLLEKIPSSSIRQFVQRLRLLGFDHFGTIQKLQTFMGSSILNTDPRVVVRKNALAITSSTSSRRDPYVQPS
jgi:nucleoside-diphosphate-sugar epimerase